MKKYSKEETTFWKNESEYQKKLYKEFKEREELRNYFNKIIKEYKRGVIWKKDYLEN